MLNPRLPVFDENSPLRPQRLGHVVLATTQVDAMSAWYQQFLHAKPMFEHPIGTFLTYDDEHHRVFLLNSPDAIPRNPESTGLAHFAFLYTSLGELLQAYDRLRSDGVTPAYCVNHGFQLSFYYADPDGNEVELGCDCFATREELDEWFSNGLFAANPFGFPVNPDEMFAFHQAGVSDAEILEVTYK
jgi:catechol-2,3-dioxygenase